MSKKRHRKTRPLETPEIVDTTTRGFNRLHFYLCTAIILFLAWNNYFKNYAYPNALYWDENYHIASAQKYLEGTFFMEMHPPLGKLLIAAGEKMSGVNDDLDLQTLAATDYVREVPPGYSFLGVRLFSALSGALSALLIYFLLFTILENPFLAVLFSLPYLFDNALIVHTRGAMLEGPQLFFVLLFLLHAVVLLKREQALKVGDYFFSGVILGLALAIKVNSAILVLAFPFFFFRDQTNRGISWKGLLQDGAKKVPAALLGLLLPYLLVWHVHFSLATKVVGSNYYNLSTAAQKLVNDGTSDDLVNLPRMIQEAITYFINYQKGVPRLKPDTPEENGSHPIFWPLGKYSISYRWDKVDDAKVKHLRLQCNPVNWFFGAAAVMLGLLLVGARVVYGLSVRNDRLYRHILLFVTLYLCYMLAMFQIDRVMYLYHYFIPLLFSFILIPLIFCYLFEEYLTKKDNIIFVSLLLFGLNIIAAFWFFSPFTYYESISGLEFMQRNWFAVWRLNLVYW